MNTNTSVLYHHGNHDQSTHGNWARKRAAAARKHGISKIIDKKSENTSSSSKKVNPTVAKIKAGYDKAWDMLESTVGTHNLRYAKNSLAAASAALWVAAELAPGVSIPMSAIAAVANAASIIIDPDS